MVAALDPAPALSGVPGLDHETVARIIEVGEYDLTDVDAEAGSLRRVSRIDRNAPSTDLGLARPAGGTLVWGILGGAVQVSRSARQAPRPSPPTGRLPAAPLDRPGGRAVRAARSHRDAPRVPGPRRRARVPAGGAAARRRAARRRNPERCRSRTARGRQAVGRRTAAPRLKQPPPARPTVPGRAR